MSEAVSRKGAAAMLGVSVRTIDNYLKCGMLTKYKEGRGRVVILSSAVEELKRDRDETVGPLLNRRVIADLRRRVAKLEAEVRLLLGMHEASPEPYRLTPEDYISLYAMATSALETPSLEAAKSWMGIFPRIDEEVLRGIQEATGHTLHGATFLKLCLALQGWLRDQEEYASNLEMQQVHMRLEFARQHLRSALVVFIETYAGASVRDLVQRLGGPDADTKSDILFRLRKSP